MSFLNRLKDMAQQSLKEGQDAFSRFNNQVFADAAMAACALIGAADGTIDQQERSKTSSFIGSSDKLKAFDVTRLRSKYDEYCDKVTRDFDFGKIELMQVIGKLKKPEEKRAVVQLAMLIAGADGTFDEKERLVVRDISNALSLDPGEFGV
ncbi:tellurite resistance TerB family protein [Deinococcus hopiensis]|uniref:Tellurite resistance protein TerB n=1 Tax=Deinococcus hopiensis KR-140 TaxID=695939 RepID=A0A1W1VWB9_9DEIO|nr:TerB family tellurite resistance protein [Deinococcus hopiensis]SMB97669.1 tellurite resistance protein TerB [Deinococcus hopiensis KR-140]